MINDRRLTPRSMSNNDFKKLMEFDLDALGIGSEDFPPTFISSTAISDLDPTKMSREMVSTRYLISIFKSFMFTW